MKQIFTWTANRPLVRWMDDTGVALWAVLAYGSSTTEYICQGLATLLEAHIQTGECRRDPGKWRTLLIIIMIQKEDNWRIMRGLWSGWGLRMIREDGDCFIIMIKGDRGTRWKGLKIETDSWLWKVGRWPWMDATFRVVWRMLWKDLHTSISGNCLAVFCCVVVVIY